MPSLSDIASTKEEPIRFFLDFHKGGRGILEKEYKKIDEPERYYDPEREAVMVFVETRIDEDVKEGAYEEYSFEDFLRSWFEDETQNSIQLIKEVYRNNNDGENAWAYKRLLNAFIKHFERLKNYHDYPECELLPSAFLTIVERAIKLYDQMYSFPSIAKVKRMIKAEGAVNTGYVIKSEYRPHINDFNDQLIKASFIDPSSKPEQWYQFFRGEFLRVKINWIVDKPDGHLWYFIKKIKESDILIAFPKQQWKQLGRVFSFNGDDIPQDFYKNHNYLGKIE